MNCPFEEVFPYFPFSWSFLLFPQSFGFFSLFFPAAAAALCQQAVFCATTSHFNWHHFRISLSSDLSLLPQFFGFYLMQFYFLWLLCNLQHDNKVGKLNWNLVQLRIEKICLKNALFSALKCICHGITKKNRALMQQPSYAIIH